MFRRLLAAWHRRRDRALFVFERSLWDSLMSELARRGRGGRREAGAFLLTPRVGDGKRVTRVLYLDDLDPTCLAGGIHFHNAGYSRLSTICDRENLRVLGDIHTHPGPWVGQSDVDRDNPMVALQGHLALIVPDYALRAVEPHEIGVHEYLGDEGWRSWLGSAAATRVRIEDS